MWGSFFQGGNIVVIDKLFVVSQKYSKAGVLKRLMERVLKVDGENRPLS